MRERLPLVALTLGDVAGIGPEVVARAWGDARLHAVARPLVVGSRAVLERAVARFAPGCSVIPVSDPAFADAGAQTIPCLDPGTEGVAGVAAGAVDARAGLAAYQCLTAAIDLARAAAVDAIVTLPLNKESLRAAGIEHPGHTEILAERCGAERHAMMLYVAHPVAASPAGLGVAHATLHVSLAEALARLSTQGVLDTIALADQAMHAFMAAGKPRIAVAGLNPHAGENGLFGREEQTLIEPAIARARALGIEVSGPIAADTLFHRAFAGEFDAVVAMYHDQGHVAVKSRAFWQAVNITIGLPIIRTSVAHGTAFDIAWQGRAKGDSLVEAVRVAARLVATGAPGRSLANR
jgi:4-hydroxythreonine-4-phosphate dehydrogenase